ncbi:MAG: ammonium transporter [Actinomycetes bacterium]
MFENATSWLATATNSFEPGDTAWVMICAALVLFMTPGLALFYGGMVSIRNVLTMMMQNFVAIGVLTVVWVMVGYSIAFGSDNGFGFTGNLGLFGLNDLQNGPAPSLHVLQPGVAIPALAFVAYQMMFAVITPALITGAVADRLKYAGWLVLIIVWSVLVYAPVCHWLFSPGGWLTKWGAEDWAGGLVVHASAGAAALAVMVVVGRRKNADKENSPFSIPIVMIGVGILWFGWFGFNAGDGLAADGVAAQALMNTAIGAATGMIGWLLMEKLKTGKNTVLGGGCGAVAGLATITPGAGYVHVWGALAIGLVAGIVCYLALHLKSWLHFDDALDVIAVHFVGGVIGTLMVGLFGTSAVNQIGVDGLFHGGGFSLLGKQAVATVCVVAFSFVLTWIIATIIDKTIGLRVDPADEDHLDQVQQGQDAYDFAGLAQALKEDMR